MEKSEQKNDKVGRDNITQIGDRSRISINNSPAKPSGWYEAVLGKIIVGIIVGVVVALISTYFITSPKN